jgi:hypothetical protein
MLTAKQAGCLSLPPAAAASPHLPNQQLPAPAANTTSQQPLLRKLRALLPSSTHRTTKVATQSRLLGCWATAPQPPLVTLSLNRRRGQKQ